MLPQDYFNKELSAAVRGGIVKGENGKKFIEALKEMCMVNTSCMNQDPYRTYYNLGKRDVALQIIKMLEEKGKQDGT